MDSDSVRYKILKLVPHFQVLYAFRETSDEVHCARTPTIHRAPTIKIKKTRLMHAVLDGKYDLDIWPEFPKE